jgi:outer membrane protein assembly factor BamB
VAVPSAVRSAPGRVVPMLRGPRTLFALGAMLLLLSTGCAATGAADRATRTEAPAASASPVSSPAVVGARPAAGAVPALPPAAYSPASPPPPWPGPLPYPILIADEGNSRMIEVTPNKRIVWSFPPVSSGSGTTANGVPGDDAFFSPNGRTITTNDEDGGTIVRVNYYTGQVVWHFGVKGQLGGGSTHLNYPDDAYLLPDGQTIVADIRNCRELFISPAGHITQVWGRPQTGYCRTDLRAGLFGYPNGDEPLPNGDILMSFISGDRIALLSPQGRPIWNVESPDLYGGYVSDPQLMANGDVLVSGYGRPGTLVIFKPQTGHVVWSYHVTSGPGELNHPSLALPLPNGNVLLNDDRNDRVIVIDPRTDRIVWQYGHTGKAGAAPGYLNTPDGVAVDYWRNWGGVAPAGQPAG